MANRTEGPRVPKSHRSTSSSQARARRKPHPSTERRAEPASRLEIERGVKTLVSYFPTYTIVATPWPHLLLSDGIISWVGRIGRRTYLRLTTLETVNLPGSINLGDGSILFPMFQGRGGANRLRILCKRGHLLPTKRNAAGRRQCWQCVYELRRTRAHGDSSSTVQGHPPVSGPGTSQ